MTDFTPIEPNLIIAGYIRPNQELLFKEIARRLKMPYVNFDALIAERMGLPIDQIRIYFGETRLRAVEAELIDETVLRRNTVLRISGRTLAQSAHLSKMKQTGSVFFLRIALGAMLSRLHVSMGARFHNPDERALILGEIKREWAVQGHEGLIDIDTTYMDDDEIMDTLTSQWREIALIRG